MTTRHSGTSNMRPVAVRLQQAGRRAPSWRPPEPGADPAPGVNRPSGFEAQTRDTVVFTVVRAMSAKPQIPPEIEEYRDERWRREGTRQVETALDAERFIEQVGFAACLTDSRRPGPSLYVAVCGLREEWEMSTADLRDESGVKERKAFTRGLDELQAAMIVVPSEVWYEPKFTYVWTLAVGRFREALLRRVSRETARREIARCFLAG